MKTIIITGANGNLGVATVKKFLDEGYKVIAVGGDNKQLDFALNNANFEFEKVNLIDEDDATAFINNAIAKYNKIDAAIMLVGGFAPGNIDATKGAAIDKMFSLNFKSAYFIARPLLQHMQANGFGRLIFIGAKPALLADQGKNLIAYSLSKSLLFKLADFINEDSKEKNIVASVVVPGTIDTPINRQSMPGANFENWVKPEQIAEILELITSEKGNPLRETVIKVYNNS
jgi:NAD(P)-dependent dehydrogenase (short-subunit alcohol dehydrogenase family)